HTIPNLLDVAKALRVTAEALRKAVEPSVHAGVRTPSGHNARDLLLLEVIHKPGGGWHMDRLNNPVLPVRTEERVIPGLEDQGLVSPGAETLQLLQPGEFVQLNKMRDELPMPAVGKHSACARGGRQYGKQQNEPRPRCPFGPQWLHDRANDGEGEQDEGD